MASAARRIRWAGGYSLFAVALALLGLFALWRSVLVMTRLNVEFAGEIDPFSRAVSYYIFVERAADTFNATLLAVATATVMILVGMAQLRVRLGRLTVILFGTWCGALLLCVLFPTDNSPRIETASGWIHQFAGASLFVTLPLAGLALARRLGDQPNWARTGRALRALAFGGVWLALCYLAARLPDLLPWQDFPDFLDWRSVAGLIQRVLFALELAMLLVLATRLLRVAWPRRRTSQWADRLESAP